MYGCYKVEAQQMPQCKQCLLSAAAPHLHHPACQHITYSINFIIGLKPKDAFTWWDKGMSGRSEEGNDEAILTH